MEADRVIRTLRTIEKVYDSILDPSHYIVIPQAIAEVEESKKNYEYGIRNQSRGIEPVPWGYSISHEFPLRFKSARVLNSIEMEVDVYCNIRWTENIVPIQQDIKLRIWTTDPETIYDEQRDSLSVLEKLTESDRGRVVTRLHFDKADLNDSSNEAFHPEYHVQYGGKAEDYEICWHPKKVNVPRLYYQPMELFLTCQLIAANFFPLTYREKIRERAEWRGELFYYQNHLLRNYYEKCIRAINDDEPLDAVLYT